ncbi:hypothetical protein EKL28_16490, partial [Staphylococcus aureus]
GIESTAQIHPSAIIADSAYIGHYAVIGENCVVGQADLCLRGLASLENATSHDLAFVNAV